MHPKVEQRHWVGEPKQAVAGRPLADGPSCGLGKAFALNCLVRHAALLPPHCENRHISPVNHFSRLSAVLQATSTATISSYILIPSRHSVMFEKPVPSTTRSADTPHQPTNQRMIIPLQQTKDSQIALLQSW